MKLIRLTQPDLGPEEEKAVVDTIRSGWLAYGPRAKALEKSFATCVGADQAVACNSGTAALSLALAGLGIGPGHEVIVPSLTFSATAAAAVHTGAKCLFADITSAEIPTLAAADCAKLLSNRTRAVIFVTYAGYAGSLAEVDALCREHRLDLIVDATHAPGGTASGKPIGSFGTCAAYSFHTTKNMTCGEGGMLVAGSGDLCSAARRFRDHGLQRLEAMDAAGYDYQVMAPGWNARMSDLAAAVANAQLRKLPHFNARRKALARLYDEQLCDTDLTLPFSHSRQEGVAHIYPVVLPETSDRRAVRSSLREKGIETAVHYAPLHTQIAYAQHIARRPLAVTENVAPRLVTLPLHPALSEEDVRSIANAVKELIA